MNLLKISLLIIAASTILSCTTKGEADSCSEFPIIKELDKKFCPKDGEQHGHTLVILDLTSKLEQAQIESIKQKVFSDDFYKEYEPFTKFSYVLISKESPESQPLLFAKCRPKVGKKTKHYCDYNINRWKESKLRVNKKWKEFFNEAHQFSESIFKKPTESGNSLIYETIMNIFELKKFDFGSSYKERNLIVVSDMMQHSDRLSFYNSCKSWNSWKPDKCPSLDKVLTPSTRKYIEGTSEELRTLIDGVTIKVILLNNNYETSANLTPSIKSLWKEFFKKFFGKEDVIFDLPLDSN